MSGKDTDKCPKCGYHVYEGNIWIQCLRVGCDYAKRNVI